MRKFLFISVIIHILIYSVSYSQLIEEDHSTNSARNLTGTHSIYSNFGFLMNSATSARTTGSEVKAETNFTGFLGYQYWFDNQWSVNASVGFFSAKADVNYTNVSAAIIVPILFGISYYPESLSLGRVGRAHFGVNTGVYMRSGVNLDNLTDIGTSSVNETVFGVEPNAGIDFMVSKRIKIGPCMSYHIVSDFKEEIGYRNNYSGPVFSINFGILL